MAKRAKIEGLPEDVRHWLERALTEKNFSGYEELEQLLRDKGYEIGKSSIHRYGQKIERRFAAIKASTEAARIISEGAGDDQDVRSEAIIALIQHELFDSIIEIQESTGEDVDQAERIGMLSSAAKNIATLTRASVALKRFQSEVRAKVRAAADSAAAVAQRGGLTADAIDSIRREILGIAK